MNLFTWLPTAVAVVLFLGAATVYLRGSRDKGTIETLERNNKALTERATILEADVDACKNKIATLTHANEVLTNTVNSSELIMSLTKSLLEHHAAAMAGMAQLHGDLDTLPERLAAVIKEDR